MRGGRLVAAVDEAFMFKPHQWVESHRVIAVGHDEFQMPVLGLQELGKKKVIDDRANKINTIGESSRRYLSSFQHHALPLMRVLTRIHKTFVGLRGWLGFSLFQAALQSASASSVMKS
jgi:hypothetical protein